jgi:hypothetical protein
LTGIEKKLSSFGDVELVGSYKYDLMGQADIDFEVYGEPNIEKIADLAREYMIMPKLIKVNLVNYTVYSVSRPSLPPGVWLGLRVDIDGELVNFDIWFIRASDRHADEFATKMPRDWWLNLSEQQREAIIYLKALSSNGGLDRDYMSVEICKAVVLADVKNQADLISWSKNSLD